MGCNLKVVFAAAVAAAGLVKMDIFVGLLFLLLVRVATCSAIDDRLRVVVVVKVVVLVGSTGDDFSGGKSVTEWMKLTHGRGVVVLVRVRPDDTGGRGRLDGGDDRGSFTGCFCFGTDVLRSFGDGFVAIEDRCCSVVGGDFFFWGCGGGGSASAAEVMVS